MVSGINGGYNPYQYSMLDQTYYNPVGVNDGPILTGGVSMDDVRFNVPPQEKRDNTADGKDDGSIGFWGATKNMAKGVWNFITSPFKNEKGEWSLGATLKSAAIAGLFIAGNALTGGALTPILLAGGAVMGAWGAGKAAYNIATAETDAQAEAAWQSMGSSAATIAATVVGAKSYAKSAAKADIASAQSELRQAVANDDVAGRLAAGQKLTAAQAKLDGYNGLKGIKNAVGRTFVDSKSNIVAGAKTGWNYTTNKFGQVKQAYKDGVLKEKISNKYHSAKDSVTQTYNEWKDTYNAYRESWKALTPDEKKAVYAELKQVVKDAAKEKFGANRAEVLANAKATVTDPRNIGIHTWLTTQTFKPDFYDSLSTEEQAYFDSLPKEQREQIEDFYYSVA